MLIYFIFFAFVFVCFFFSNSFQKYISDFFLDLSAFEYVRKYISKVIDILEF